jgi:arsenate reductase-like glutaredoxin family protein
METKEKRMIIRVFGSYGCEDCKSLRSILRKCNISYEYINAMAKDKSVDFLCEIYNVDLLPHMQFMNEDDRKVIKESVGFEECVIMLSSEIL